ncbi:hypothetical protein AB0K60_26535 [Thermopolyspora sp. NPDC052614]
MTVTADGRASAPQTGIRVRKPKPRTPRPPLDLRTPSGRRLPY